MSGVNPNEVTVDTAFLLSAGTAQKQTPEETEKSAQKLIDLGIAKRNG
jgi:hypothetical protein